MAQQTNKMNSWIDQQNAIANQWNAGNGSAQWNGQSYPIAGWQPKPLQQEPADMPQFRQQFGEGFASADAYGDWQRNQQRETTMADFVNKMATPQNQAMQDKFSGQVGDFSGAVNAQIAAPQPVLQQATMNTGNRYEGGLGNSENRLNALLTDTNALNLSPAYKFRVQQGEEALQRSLGARGLLNSGNRLKALSDYGQESGSQEYEAEFGRRKGMFDAYAGNYNTDKAANTSRYGVEQGANVAGFNAANTANNQRLGTLGDLLRGASTAYNQGSAINLDDRAKWGNIWNQQAPKPVPYNSSPTTTFGFGGVKSSNTFDGNLTADQLYAQQIAAQNNQWINGGGDPNALKPQARR